MITAFTRQRIGHNRTFPAIIYKLFSNSSPASCSLQHHDEAVCDFNRIVIHRASLIRSGHLLFSFLSSISAVSLPIQIFFSIPAPLLSSSPSLNLLSPLAS